jgi:hypothetical protein
MALESIDWDETTNVIAARIKVARKSHECHERDCQYGGVIEPGDSYIEIIALDWKQRMQREVGHLEHYDSEIYWQINATARREKNAKRRKLVKSN